MLPRIEEIDTDDLRKELERREIEEKTQAIPRAVESPDLTALKEICREYIDDLAEDGRADEDYNEYVFEVAIQTFYGDSVWEWVSARSK